MKPDCTITKSGWGSLAGALAGLALIAGCGGGAPEDNTVPRSARPSAAPAANTNEMTNAAPPRASVFRVEKGLRDPFFPDSKTSDAEPEQAAAPVDLALVLREGFQGVMGAGDTRLAVINNVILEPGRRTEIPVQTSSGTRMIKVRCRQVLNNAVVLEVDGQSQPLTITSSRPRR